MTYPVQVVAPQDVVLPPVSDIELGRRRYRRDRAVRSTAVAAVSTLLFAFVVAFGLSRAPGWSRIQQSFFDFSLAKKSFHPILDGLWLNLRVLAVSEVCILALALLVAGLRTVQGAVFFPVRVLATAYVDFFRGLPLIILLYLIGFGVPGLRFSWLPNNPTVLGTIALVLCYGAYVAEVFRSGIQSVHPSQRAAAASIGLTYMQSMRLVILPQAIRRVVPPLLNDFVALQKDVGLISVLGAIDAVRQAQILQAQYFNFTPYVVAGLMFVVLAIPTGRVADAAAARARRREQSGSLV
jgi:polar amino acid transport system permease protein